MNFSGSKHDGRAAKTATVAAVDVLGGVRETEPPPPDPDPSPPPPPPLVGDVVLDSGADEDILRTKRSWILLKFK